MRKLLLPLFVTLVILGGLSAVFLLSKQSGDIRNRAAVSGGIGSVSLSPSTGSHNVGDIFPVILNIKTGGANISSVSLRMTYNYTGTSPELEVVDQNGNVVNQIYPASGLTSTGDWSFPVKSVTRAGGVVTIDFAGIDTNINGFNAATDTALATIYFKVTRAATAPINVNFDLSQSKMLTKADPPTDILNNPSPGSYSVITTANINMKFKLQGVNGNIGPKDVSVILKKDGVVKYTFSAINVTPAVDGTFTAPITGITPDTYDAYIKPLIYLEKKFAVTAATTGTINLDFTNTPLLVGDFDNNNRINVTDIGGLLSQYTALTVPVTAQNKIVDVNGDGAVDIKDIAIVLSNYTQLELVGD